MWQIVSGKNKILILFLNYEYFISFNYFNLKVTREGEMIENEDDYSQQQQQQQQRHSPSVSPQPSPALSYKQQQQQKHQAPTAPTPRPQLADEATNDLDNFDIIACTVQRREDYPGIGLSLSTAVNHPNRSVSPQSIASSSLSNNDKDESSSNMHLPIITNIDEGSPAQKSGLRVGDLVLEINGKSTNGQTNSNIAKWIRSGGNTIEFVVSRAKQSQPQQPQQPQQRYFSIFKF